MIEKSLEIIRNARKRKCSKCGDIIPAGAKCVKYSYDKTGGGLEIHKKEYWCLQCEGKTECAHNEHI